MTTSSPSFNSKMPTFSLAGNTTLVTGSSEGIGLALTMDGGLTVGQTGQM